MYKFEFIYENRTKWTTTEFLDQSFSEKTRLPIRTATHNDIEFEDNDFDEDEETTYQNVAKYAHLYNHEKFKRHL